MPCGLYFKPMTIVNDDSWVINKLEASLTDDTRVVIYDRHMFIVQDAELQPQKVLWNRSLASIFDKVPMVFSSASWPTLEARVTTVSIMLSQFSRSQETGFESPQWLRDTWDQSYKTFYEQHLLQNLFVKNLQTQIVRTLKLRKILLYEKAAFKILVKLTPGKNVIKLFTSVIYKCS
jgi:hypothetical protein